MYAGGGVFKVFTVRLVFALFVAEFIPTAITLQITYFDTFFTGSMQRQLKPLWNFLKFL